MSRWLPTPHRWWSALRGPTESSAGDQRRSGSGSTRPGPARRPPVEHAGPHLGRQVRRPEPARGSWSTRPGTRRRRGAAREAHPIVTEDREVGGRHQPPPPGQARSVGQCLCTPSSVDASRSSSAERRPRTEEQHRVPPGAAPAQLGDSPSRIGQPGQGEQQRDAVRSLVRTGSESGLARSRAGRPGRDRGRRQPTAAGSSSANGPSRKHTSSTRPTPAAGRPPRPAGGAGRSVARPSTVRPRAWGQCDSPTIQVPPVGGGWGLTWVHGAGNGRSDVVGRQRHRVGVAGLVAGNRGRRLIAAGLAACPGTAHRSRSGCAIPV